MQKLLHKVLSTNNSKIDEAETTIQRQQTIQKKIFLKKIYEEWYESIVSNLPTSLEGSILELGSGGGFLKQIIPELITSDVLHLPYIEVVLDGQLLPFRKDSLKSIVMIDVLHHLPDANKFFNEASRCLKSTGKIIMIEPWNTLWSRLIYTQLHHEPFIIDTTEWEFPKTGPLSGANGALPWIIFHRDRELFTVLHPELEIYGLEITMPFRYIISGGFSSRSLMPNWTFDYWRKLENILTHQMDKLGMFATIVLSKN